MYWYFWTGVRFSSAPPVANLFELFELLDRYQSEMIDFFVVQKNYRNVGVYDKYN
ncbi:MAG: hypothetical protein Q4E39_06230 [bacterium]|nr:hypothetical protein [bacterium]